MNLARHQIYCKRAAQFLTHGICSLPQLSDASSPLILDPSSYAFESPRKLVKKHSCLIPVFVIYCCVTNHGTVQWLKKHTFIISQFLWVTNRSSLAREL